MRYFHLSSIWFIDVEVTKKKKDAHLHLTNRHEPAGYTDIVRVMLTTQL